MTKLLAFIGTLALALVSLTAADAADPSPDLPLSLAVSPMPGTLVKGDTMEIAVATCRPAPGESIAVERRVLPDGTWSAVRTSTLSADGTALFTVRPNSLRTFEFRVALGGADPATSASSAVTVVAPSDTDTPVGTVAAAPADVPAAVVSRLPERLTKGESVPIHVATCPADPGASVSVQRRVAPDGSWSTVRSGTIDSDGLASFSVRPNSLRSFDFRVAVGGARPTVTEPQTVTVVAAPPPTTSGSVTVSDLPATMVTGSSVPLTVTTSPAAAGAPVVVERQINGGDWSVVRSTRLDSSGAKTFDLNPVATRSYGFRVVVDTDPPLTSRAQTITVVGASDSGSPSSGTTIKRYQLFDDRSDQWLPRGRWVNLQSYATRPGVATKNIVQLNMNIRGATGDRPTYVLVAWLQGGARVGHQTLTIPWKGGDRPFQVSHDYTSVSAGDTTAQLYVPGSGQVKVTTEVVKAVAHPSH